MKANEFIIESKESLLTYLGLLGINCEKLQQDSDNIISHHSNGRISDTKLKTYLNEINLIIIQVIEDKNLWANLKIDPDVGEVYNMLASTYNKNFGYLEKL